MPQDNKVEKLIINQLTKEQYKNLTGKSKTEIYDITDEEHYTADEMQSLLDKKQDKLTAGKGLEITSDNIINNTQTSAEWGNITGDISTQTDLKSALDLKANDNNVVHISTYETINDIKTFADKTIFNGGTGGVTDSPSIEVKNHIITGGIDVTTWSGIQSNRKCTNDNNLVNTASLIVNSDGTTKISHKRGTENEIGVGEDAYLTLDAEKLIYAKSDIKGNSSTTEYEVYHSGNLVAGDNVELDKINGVTTIDVNIPTVLTDNTTIIKDDKDTISTIGVKTKSNGVLYEWVGTKEEYEAGLADGTITLNTECLIVDDEQELIGTVDLNIPTKLSELANDTKFITQNEVNSFNTRITTNENNINSLNTKVTTNENNINSLNTKVTTNENNINSLNTKVTTNENNINSLNTKVTINENNITNLQNSKQNNLTAGEGIKIENDVISNTQIIPLSSNDEFKLGESKTSVVTPYQVNNFGSTVLSNNGLITNCVIEEPQRIKLDLTDGNLTLKKGSELFIPNGFETDGKTPHFDTYIMPNDRTGGTSSSQLLYSYHPTLDMWGASSISNCYSGDTAPTPTINTYWYDTANNILKRWLDNDHWEGGFSLPPCIASSTYISYVCNSIAFCGKTYFYLPGLKALAPNGTTPDGKINNIVLSTDKVLIKTDGGGTNQSRYMAWLPNNQLVDFLQLSYFEGLDGQFPSGSVYYSRTFYATDTKKIYICYGNTTDWIEQPIAITGKLQTNSTNTGLKYLYANTPVELAHADDLDGIWQGLIGQTIVQNATINSSTKVTYDLSSFLPKDGNNYMIFLDGSLTINSNMSGKRIAPYISSDIQTACFWLSAPAISDSAIRVSGQCMFHIGPLRTLNIQAGATSSEATGVYNMYLRGYRKIR